MMGNKSTIYHNRKHGGISSGKLLQLGRRVTAVAALSIMVLFFVMLGSSAALKLRWITTIQIVPVALAVSGSLILFWLLVTLLFGRVYCSMVCPMGILQDLSARVQRPTRKLKFRHGYKYHAPNNKFRYIWLGIIIVSLIAGMSMLLALFDPYGAFGRFMTCLLRPLIAVAKGQEIAAGTLLGIVIAAVTLIAVVAVSMWRGRLICNTVCPVGSALSLVSRHSVFGMDINTDACVNCGLCSRVCKAECIDVRQHTVDMSRCVVCFDCTAVCDNGAITYTSRKHRLAMPMLMKVPGPRAAATFDSGRRKFIVSGVMMVAGAVVLSAEDKIKKMIPHKPKVKGQLPTTDVRPVPPPGIASTHSFLTKCIGCGACIATCPMKVLHPSSKEYGMGNPLHPLKNYDTSYCLYECVKCTEVCPTGALEPLSVKEKETFRVGLAIVDPEACIGCGLCARNCPRETITMEKRATGKGRVAIVNHADCIGCGVCQYVCPAQPLKAIKVNGLQR